MKVLILGAISVKAFGSLMFVFGSFSGASILLLHQAISAPILYDFYNYDANKKECSAFCNSRRVRVRSSSTMSLKISHRKLGDLWTQNPLSERSMDGRRGLDMVLMTSSVLSAHLPQTY
ncbi:HR-like lesion-inducing protein-related [Striga hermonthica]|uniref:HR-like lesion-inducing protein-related n=1 Tax=Striga hermonthica TaxID=68872 RepID=A0A9N7P2N7_STRHE|nr:HR-like lesion-inducing protein-related [Striga hermonthica]